MNYDIYASDNHIDSIFKSEFVGLQIFKNLFSKEEFLQSFSNTLIISAMKIVLLFPLPIILALMINAVHQNLFKKMT